MPDPAAPDDAALRACLAQLLGVPVAALPAPAGPDPLPALRSWLSQRDRGLAGVADPARFSWPGFWLARIRDAPAGPLRWVLMFGVPSGVVFDPSGRPAQPAHEVVAGYVVGVLDPSSALPVGAGAGPGAGAGVVDAIYVAAAAEAPMRRVETVHAGVEGLEGDRYVRGEGTFSDPSATGTALTLIEAEALAAVELADGSRLAPELARRNVVTRGIDLNALVGRRFAVGEVECYGQRRCQPCAHWQRLTRPGVLRGFVHRGGLRADVLTPGTLRPGLPVRLLD
jgi:hypothetical protein